MDLNSGVNKSMQADWTWKTLRVDLTARSFTIEERSKQWVRKFPGGRAFGAYHLSKEVSPGVDALSPENKLIFAAGVLTHCKFSGTSRFSTIAKSPLTGGYGEAIAGGWWGPELVSAGFNAIILEGQADSPVFLWIHDGEVEFRDAQDLWDTPNDQCYAKIRDDLGKVRVAQIGPAGERKIRYASIISDLRHVNGRTGMGAVMGSKNLKAIAVQGSGEPFIADPESFESIRKWHNQYLLESFYGKYFREHGTSAGLEYQNVMGGLPTNNFQHMTFTHAADIGGPALEEEFLETRRTCHACVLRCKPVMKVDPDEQFIAEVGGPEYESIAALGSLCGISDLKAIVRANALANNYGLDSISLGSSIAFAMECYEAGILTKDDTDGLELRFGNAEAMLEMIDSINNRRGIGDLLAEGIDHAAKVLGGGADEYALHVKGQEFPMHDPRGKISQALAYAVSPTGADHNTSSFDDMYAKKGQFLNSAAPLGILEPIPEKELNPEKVRLYTYLHLERSLLNSLLICQFVTTPTTMLTINKLTEVVRAVTGWDVSEWELMKVGERGTTLARWFNMKQGLTKDDDWLPKRMFKEVESGPKMGRRVDETDLREAISLYYGMMGWDSNGIPSPAKLHELGLSDLVPA
jgi:aldehyde:ferredoxin oxidoreductase